MTEKTLPNHWQHLLNWWNDNKDLYNVPALAARAGLYKGRVYAALQPGSQGGSTVRYTDELYEQLVGVLESRYRRPRTSVDLDEATVRELYEQQGLGLEATATTLGITMPTLRKYMREMGIASRPVGAPGAGVSTTPDELRAFIQRNWTAQQAADHLAISKAILERQMEAMGFVWSEEIAAWRRLLWTDMAAHVDGNQKAQLLLKRYFVSLAAMRRALVQRLPPSKPAMLKAAAALAAETGFTSAHFWPLAPIGKQ